MTRIELILASERVAFSQIRYSWADSRSQKRESESQRGAPLATLAHTHTLLAFH